MNATEALRAVLKERGTDTSEWTWNQVCRYFYDLGFACGKDDPEAVAMYRALVKKQAENPDQTPVEADPGAGFP